jgi:hypothetical protein
VRPERAASGTFVGGAVVEAGTMHVKLNILFLCQVKGQQGIPASANAIYRS